MKFFKMHGIGNDYIFLDMMQEIQKYDFKKLAKIYCDRNFGIGSCGIIVLYSCNSADVKMKIYNADGSEGNMCGNACRCVALYLLKKYGKQEIFIQTNTRKVETKVFKSTKNSATVVVDMGQGKLIKEELTTYKTKHIKITFADVGNLHGIVFVKNFDFNLQEIGEFLSKKYDANIEFIKIIDKNKIAMKVYERGSGITLACGSGSCASAYISQKKKYIEKGKTKVFLDGGMLEIEIDENDNIYQKGEAKYVFCGES